MNYVETIANSLRAAIPRASHPTENADALFLQYALLVLVRGEETTLRDVHDAWSIWMQNIDPSHPSLVPFERLTPQVRAEDRTYRDAIIDVARAGRA